MNHIDTFKELFNEIFYDWGMTPNPQIKKKESNFFWINKTSIIKTIDNEITLTYKTSNYPINEKVYNEFLDFFEDYANDSEFEQVLDNLQDYWVGFDPKIVIQNDVYMLNSFSLFCENYKYYYSNPSDKIEISKVTYIKTKKFMDNLMK